MKAGSDVAKIAKEWGEEITDLDGAEDWESAGEATFEHQSRWCTHWSRVFKHDSGLSIKVSYAQDVGDGESSMSYPTTWEEVESHEVSVTQWRKIEGGKSGSV